MTIRLLPVSNNFLLLVAAVSPYLIVASGAMALLMFIVSKHWVLTGFALVLTVVALAGPLQFYYLGGVRPEDRPHVDIRVLTANLRYGLAHPDFLVSLARDHADLVSVQELTPGAIQRLSEAGIGSEFPYSVLIPGEAADGGGLWSRYPIAEIQGRHSEVGMMSVRLRIPGVRTNPVLAGVHIGAPISRPFDDWHAAITDLARLLGRLAATAPGGAVLVAGDFNTTPDMQNFRQLLTNGYQDAVQQTGAGSAPSFPSNAWYPPLIAIDHVLVRGATATSVHTITVPGSDHRAVLATVQVPLDPTASYGPG